MSMVCLQNGFSLFMFLLTPPFVKNSHFLAGIHFIFLKQRVIPTWKTFNIKFGTQWKDRKSIYQIRQIVALFCILLRYVYVKTVLKALESPKL